MAKWREEGENGWRERLEKNEWHKGAFLFLSLTQCGSSGKGRAAQCKHVCVNSSMGRGQLFEMTAMAANAQSVYLPTDLFIHTHSHNDHNELAAKHKCAANTYTVHTCHLCMTEWVPVLSLNCQIILSLSLTCTCRLIHQNRRVIYYKMLWCMLWKHA